MTPSSNAVTPVAGRRRPSLEQGMIVGGRYQVRETIGEGGMAQLYEAVDVLVDRVVALKTLRVDLDETARRRLAREAKLTASVVHPNVVRILDVVLRELDAVLVLERLHGSSLRQILEVQGALGLPEAFRYLDELLGALGACHAVGVVHRDVKPENLMVVGEAAGAGDRLVLIDFGLGKPVDEDEGITEDGFVVGTPGYLAPEQLLDQRVGPATDIHGFGVTAYEVLTGRRLYQCDGTSATLAAILTRDLPSVCAIRPAVPPAVDSILRHALAKAPNDRWADVGSLRCAWRHAWSELGG